MLESIAPFRVGPCLLTYILPEKFLGFLCYRVMELQNHLDTYHTHLLMYHYRKSNFHEICLVELKVLFAFFLLLPKKKKKSCLELLFCSNGRLYRGRKVAVKSTLYKVVRKSPHCQREEMGSKAHRFRGRKVALKRT